MVLWSQKRIFSIEVYDQKRLMEKKLLILLIFYDIRVKK
jgi:hypothetical protein